MGRAPFHTGPQSQLWVLSSHLWGLSRINERLDRAFREHLFHKVVENSSFAFYTIVHNLPNFCFLLISCKEESEKLGLKFNIQKTKITASGPTTSWETDGETVSDFIWGAPKSLQMVTAAMKLKDAYSLERKL